MSEVDQRDSKRPRGNEVKLYSYWRSSCSWRVRLALELKGVTGYEYVPVHLVKNGGEQHGTDYISSVNPMREVPTLVIDGATLKQSLAIIEYLDETRSGVGPELLPKADPIKRQRVRQLSDLISSGIQAVQNLRVLQLVMSKFDDADKKKKEKIDWGKHWISQGFTALEAELANCAGTCCVGDEITMADLCLIPQVYNANRFGVDMSQFPLISKIDSYLSSKDAFKAAHPDSQPDAQQ